MSQLELLYSKEQLFLLDLSRVRPRSDAWKVALVHLICKTLLITLQRVSWFTHNASSQGHEYNKLVLKIQQLPVRLVRASMHLWLPIESCIATDSKNKEKAECIETWSRHLSGVATSLIQPGCKSPNPTCKNNVVFSIPTTCLIQPGCTQPVQIMWSSVHPPPVYKSFLNRTPLTAVPYTL